MYQNLKHHQSCNVSNLQVINTKQSWSLQQSYHLLQVVPLNIQLKKGFMLNGQIDIDLELVLSKKWYSHLLQWYIWHLLWKPPIANWYPLLSSEEGMIPESLFNAYSVSIDCKYDCSIIKKKSNLTRKLTVI